jgi:hypothetical protein
MSYRIRLYTRVTILAVTLVLVLAILAFWIGVRAIQVIVSNSGSADAQR